MTQPSIRFESVSKRYRLRHTRSFRDIFFGLAGQRRRVYGPEQFYALQDVSFVVQPGETLGLIGANGAGKSTTLKLISGVAAPTAGRAVTRGRIGALLELGAGFHPELSGRDNIYLSGALFGMSQAELRRKYDDIVAFSELGDFIDMPVKHYSSGMYARLGFAVSIYLEPDILLVDEVLAVGDQAFQRKCLQRIDALRAQGITLCFVSHDLDVVRRLCSRALWLEQGRLMADGPAGEVVDRYLEQLASRSAEREAARLGSDTGRRWGNRQVEVTGVTLTDGRGEERRVYSTGETLVIQLDFQAAKPVQSPIFGIAIHRSDGTHVCGPNTGFGGLDLGLVSGSGRVRYTIPYLPLLDGVYQLSVAVVDKADTEMYDVHDRAYDFRVSNGQGGMTERYGVVTVRGDWSYGPALVAEGS